MRLVQLKDLPESAARDKLVVALEKGKELQGNYKLEPPFLVLLGMAATICELEEQLNKQVTTE
jgi:hypothetical protein